MRRRSRSSSSGMRIALYWETKNATPCFNRDRGFSVALHGSRYERMYDLLLLLLTHTPKPHP